MSLFLPFALALAVFWLGIGVMLARFLAQKYRGRPWGKKTVGSEFVYGGALRNDGRRAGGLDGGLWGSGRGV